MTISRICKTLLDNPPRQLFHLARTKILNEEQRGDFDSRHPCIFVLSTGRAGTQTLAALCALAPNVFAYHEPNPELTSLSKLYYKYKTESGKSNALQDVFREAFLTSRRELLNYTLDCKRGYIETTPQNTFLAPAIRSAIPNARFIHLVRDPRYVVRSAMRRKWYDGNSNDESRISPDPYSEVGQQWATYNAFQKNLWLWAETNRWSLDFALSTPEMVCRIQAETLFTGDEAVMGKLFSFIGAPMPPNRRIKNVLSNQLNAQKTGIFPEFSDWSEEMNNDLKYFTGEIAKILGYDI